MNKICIDEKERLEQKHKRGKGKFNCGCGKRYNNYSAFYKHLKNYIEHKRDLNTQS